MNGQVLDNQAPNYAKAIHEFNQYLIKDNRIDMVMLPIADGLTIAYKKDLNETL